MEIYNQIKKNKRLNERYMIFFNICDTIVNKDEFSYCNNVNVTKKQYFFLTRKISVSSEVECS